MLGNVQATLLGQQLQSSVLFRTDCDSFTTPVVWTDIDDGNGASSLSTLSGKDVFLLQGTTGVAANPSIARRQATLPVTIPSKFYVELNINIDDVGVGTARGFQFYVFPTATAAFYISINDNYLYIYNGSAWNSTGITFSKDVFQRWRFECDYTTESTATVDIYRDGVLQASSVDCSWTGSFTLGLINVLHKAPTLSGTNWKSHIDYIEIDAL